ncbi:MAG: TonB-dependent receptor [Bacteroidaceae bacterium]|nr:TonB-dependent receptor [Bacteroidaceae bacterium]
MKRVILLLVLQALLVGYARPQTSGHQWRERTDTLRTVRVNASRRLRDTGLQTTTLDTLALRESISLSMADVLTQHSALFVKSYGRATESTAEFRGTSPSHTQVLWNGMRINSPMLGTMDFSFIPSYFIDGARLYHGASSLTQTGGGLGGAVELRSEPPRREGLMGQYILGAGSFATFDHFLRLAWQSGTHWSASTRFAYGTSENDFRYTNYDKKVDVRDDAGNILRSYHPRERNKSGYFDDLHLMQDCYYNDLRGNRWGATLWLTTSTRGLPFLSVDYKEDSDFRNEQGLDALRGIVSYSHTETQWTADIRAGYAHQGLTYDYYTTRAGTRTDITHSRSYANTAFAQATADIVPAAGWMLTASLATYYNHVRSWDRSPFHLGDNFDIGQWEGHAAVQLRWRPRERFTIAAIMRDEMYRTRFQQPTPALMADYLLLRPWQLTLKASIASNRRHPSMDDLYYRPGGNPNLKSERGFTYDAGLSWKRDAKSFSLSGNVAAFDSHISDWIQWTPNTKGFWVPDNVKRVHAYGIESALKAETALPHHWRAALTANYAFTPSINRGQRLSSDDASYGKQLCYVPRHSANLTARLQWRQWELTYHWICYSERFTTTSNETRYITGRLLPYYMNNVSLARRFRWRMVDASLRLAVNNLMDSEYVTVLSRPMPPRNYAIYFEISPLWKPRTKQLHSSLPSSPCAACRHAGMARAQRPASPRSPMPTHTATPFRCAMPATSSSSATRAISRP